MSFSDLFDSPSLDAMAMIVLEKQISDYDISQIDNLIQEMSAEGFPFLDGLPNNSI